MNAPDPLARESFAAQAHLGVAHPIFGPGSDTTLYKDKADLIAYADGLVKRFKPVTVVTHFHADTHQDHVATYEIAIAAARSVKNILLFKPTFPSGRTDIPFHPNFVSVLSDRNMDAKLFAMQEFISQKAKYGEDLWINSLKPTAAGDAWTYGGYHGYAELFQVSRLVCN